MLYFFPSVNNSHFKKKTFPTTYTFYRYTYKMGRLLNKNIRIFPSKEMYLTWKLFHTNKKAMMYPKTYYQTTNKKIKIKKGVQWKFYDFLTFCEFYEEEKHKVHWCLFLQELWCAYCILVCAVYWVCECAPLAITSMLPVVILPLAGQILNSARFHQAL